MYSDLEKSILAALVYFDFLGRPLTLWELQKCLPRWREPEADSRQKVDIWSLQKCLASDDLRAKIGSQSGFYYLAGRDDLARAHLNRYGLLDEKYKKAIRVAKIFKFFPFLRAIAVCGSLSYQSALPDSDLDFFIVAADAHVWAARFFVNLFLKIFGLRSDTGGKKDKICASFFTDQSSQNLNYIEHYKNERHFHYWLAHFNFIYGNLNHEFENENHWLKACLPNFYFNQPNGRRRVDDTRLSQTVRRFLELIFGARFWENFFRRVQEKKMPKNYQALAAQGQEVILNAHTIKIHTGIKGRQMNNILIYKLKEFGLYE